MTWKDIICHGSHQCSKHRMSKDARDRLKEIRQDDIDELFSLRLTGKRRVWGIKVGRVLNFLWFDPKHLVCPSPKKNT